MEQNLNRDKISKLVILLLLVLALPLAAALVGQRQEVRKEAAGTGSIKLTLSPASGDKVRGQSFPVNVVLTAQAARQIYAGEVQLQFISTVFDISGVTCGGNFPLAVTTGVSGDKINLVCSRQGGAAAYSLAANTAVILGSFTATAKANAPLGATTIAFISGKVPEGSTVIDLSDTGTTASYTITTGGAPTNTPVPTVTQPAGATGNFYLGNTGGTAVTTTFNTDVFFNSQGVSTKNFQVAFHFDSAKVIAWNSGVVDTAHLESDGNNSGGTGSYVLLRTRSGNTFAKAYGTAGGAAEKIGTITFQFQGTNKQANVIFDSATSGSWSNVTVAGVKTAATAPNYCYFIAGGSCGAATPTNTPAPTNTPRPTSTPLATNTPVPTATPTVTLTPTATPTMGSNERCRLTVVGGPNHTLGETVRIQFLQKPKFPDNDCYYASLAVNVSPGGQTITVPGFSRDARTQEFTWATTGKSAGTYTFSSLYGGHSDNCPNQACCDNSDTCDTSVVLAAPTSTPRPPTPTPTTGACAKLTFPDATGDNQVGVADFVRWKDEYTGVLTTKTADFNCNNSVDVADFVIWKDYYVAH